MPIMTSDYVKPLSLHLEQGARILSAEVAELAPASLNPRFTVDDSRLTIEPLFLNSGEAFTIRLFATPATTMIRTIGMVAGIHDVELEPVDLGSARGATGTRIRRFIHYFADVLLITASMIYATLFVLFVQAPYFGASVSSLFLFSLFVALLLYLVTRRPRDIAAS
ncbi:MAG: hypothetical protein ACRDIB_18265 [Ardenticatenaceae bacterium]